MKRAIGALALWSGISLAFCASVSASATQSNSVPEDFGANRARLVHALHNPCLYGRIVTCYTPGYRSRAVALQRFLHGELSFVRLKLAVSVPLELAVLDERQWPLVEQTLPYAMPSVHGEPPIALVAANWAAAKGFYPSADKIQDSEVHQEIARHGLTWDEANAQVGDSLSAHELGHAAIEAYGINPGSHWLDEFLASYIWYAYISDRHPEALWLFDVLQAGNELQRSQRFVTLDELDTHYEDIVESDMKTNNYGWYQGQFIERVRQVYPSRGMDFLKEIRTAFPLDKAPQLGTDETLRRIERIDPSFGEWAKTLASKPRTKDTTP
jgi:hypothetical protein